MEVIKAMVDEFVGRLRKELIELYECEILHVRGRSGSTDTGRLSMESLAPKKQVAFNHSIIAVFFFKSDKHAAT